MAPTARLVAQVAAARSSVPLFLCPILGTGDNIPRVSRQCRSPDGTISKANIHVESAKDAPAPPPQLLNLPRSCPGCGAYTQLIKSCEPGFYSAHRKSMKTLPAERVRNAIRPGQVEASTFEDVLESANQSLLSQLGLYEPMKILKAFKNGRAIVAPVLSDEMRPPICDRCHQLRHHHVGASIIHPSLQSIREIISESPYKYNHIYHVLDAADFPLSLVPSIQKNLSLSPPRSLNRRAKTKYFQHGRTAEISYIITRSDLLAPKKEHVDGLMPYMVEVLRDALGGSVRNIRLGNVHCVSSKRGWWTKTLKENIYERGGGGWMVGKVNVGKSNLFEHVYPKGRTQDVKFGSLRDKARNSGRPDTVCNDGSSKYDLDPQEQTQDSSIINESPLPPVPKEIPFPILPLVSSLPGTTASPIRLSFGNGKGELIDLPGLDRGDLQSFVLEDRKLDLVMRNRVKPKQLTIKPGQSLLVGGLVQITPTTPDVNILAYPFVPLPCHVSSTEKSHSIIMDELESGVPNIAKPGLGNRMRLAGAFPLKWDVTKQRAGPLTAKAAAGLRAETLPFLVLSTDILIEGCGWVELVAQVRKKDFLESEIAQTKGFFDNKAYPTVEVVSPDGRHVGFRRPMGAWLLGGTKIGAKTGAAGRRTSRPRRSMKGVKKALKNVACARTFD